jgi:hypothetical protein
MSERRFTFLIAEESCYLAAIQAAPEGSDPAAIGCPPVRPFMGARDRLEYGLSHARGKPGAWRDREADFLAWAEGKTSGPRRSTSDPGRAARGVEAA